MGSNERNRLRNIRQAKLVAVGFLVLVCAVFAYSSFKSRPGEVDFTFTMAGGRKSKTYRLEVAATDSEKAKGLMFRKEMAPDRGMIFVYPKEGDNSFWMKNTYLSLDMLFLDSKFKVVGILEKVPVLNTEPRGVGLPSRYVIELNAGQVAEQGIKVGAQGETDAKLPQGDP
jgi:uncharacterized membrane protein (UPF0127 family)